MAAALTVSEESAVKVVSFHPETELDASNIGELEQSLYALVEGPTGQRIVLDMGNVIYASSRALGCLVTLRLKAARSGCEVVMASLPGPLVDIVQLTNLDKLYEIHPTRDAAVKRLTNA
ncbi:MAG: hypothetical protein AMXMBFR47_33560 [Planctomycetota bacterium]